MKREKNYTMSYSQKYALVHFTSSIQLGASFHMSDWPVHVTLADVFAIDRHGIDIDEKLAHLLTKAEPVQTTALHDALLGTAPVVLLDKTASLIALHTAIVALLEENGATFNTPEFTKDGFLPHSTIQKSGRLHTGDTIVIDSISLVDMFPGGDWMQRRILMTFPMKQLL